MKNSYLLKSQQFESVSSLPGAERYAHFVKRVADFSLLWGLRGDSGWVSVADDEGKSGIPFWPHPQYAQACAHGEWAGNSPEPIEVHEFVEEWVPSMAADDVSIAVFPTPAMKGVFVAAEFLARDLRNELSRIE